MLYINPWVDLEILKRVEAQYVDHYGFKLSKRLKSGISISIFRFSLFSYKMKACR